MTPAGRLYRGHVMHMRLIPRTHRFRYRVFSVLIDLDRMDEAVAGLRLIGVERRAPLSIRACDHGARDGSPLRPWVDAQMTRAGLPRPHRVEMHCFPRLWGYVFNPLTVYFGYDRAERLESVLYEVKNTIGGQIAYALPAGPPSGGLHRHAQDKSMTVSPFIGMAQRYRFDLAPPGQRLRLRIRQAGPEGETLIATHTAEARPLSDREIARAIAAQPLMTLKVIGAIHWEALKLYLKGVPFLGLSQETRAG